MAEEKKEQVKQENKAQIIITFDPPNCAYGSVEFKNIDKVAIAAQLVSMGEFLANLGRKSWEKRPAPMILPGFPTLPGLSGLGKDW